MPQPSKRSTQFFSWLFILAGVVALGFGAWNLLQSLRCTRWPVAQGVITSADISSHSGGKGGKTYAANISYDYRVAGTHYICTRLAYGVMNSSHARAQAVLNRYPLGKKVPVYYAPNDPGEAVLETGVHGGTWICFGVGTVFVLAGAMFLGFFSPANRAGLPAP